MPHPEGVGEEHIKTHIIHLFSWAIFFIAVIIDSLFNFTTVLAFVIPLYIKLGLFTFFLLIGTLFAYWSGKVVFQIDAEEKILLKTGIYAHARHPMYLTTHLIFLGVFLLTFSLLSIIPWAVSIMLFNYIMSYEEKNLEEIFGEEYLDYKDKVPRWIPRLTPAKFD